MSSTQITAFTSGAGVTPANLTLAIASILAVLLFLWGAWIALAQLKLWREGNGTLYDLKWNIIRSASVILLLGLIVR